MKISILGCGRVGSLVAFKLLEDAAGELLLANEPHSWADALKLDLAGAFPDRSIKSVLAVDFRKAVEEGDILVVTAGVARQPSQTRDDLLEANKQVIGNVLRGLPKQSAFIVVATNPPDVLADFTAKLTGLAPERVLGVGGDVDTNRLRYLLEEEGAPFQKAIVVGEHGERMIPVADVEVSEQTASGLRSFGSRIIQARGDTLFGVSLWTAKLVESLLSPKPEKHVASIYLKEYGCHLTWPCKVSESGVTPLPLGLDEEQKKQLEELVRSRKT
ncbi:hypothetical protein HYS54_01960 [Candidatus Micrarchaeota archaeon]|nr:hypothetical protein [Candidatus Micrarchaeota archaeon]